MTVMAVISVVSVVSMMSVMTVMWHIFLEDSNIALVHPWPASQSEGNKEENKLFPVGSLNMSSNLRIVCLGSAESAGTHAPWSQQ